MYNDFILIPILLFMFFYNYITFLFINFLQVLIKIIFRAFTSLCYSADGTCIIAGGQSKNVCIYSIQESLLLKKFEITQNRSLDAVDVSNILYTFLSHCFYIQ